MRPMRAPSDTDAMLYRKGPGMEARLCYIGHGLMENRSGLIVDARLTRVSGHAERRAALEMIEPLADRPRAVTLGADRGYDAADFVEELRGHNVRPHVARNTSRRRSAIAGRTTRHPGIRRQSADPQAHRGGLWLDQDVAGMGRPSCGDDRKVDWAFTFAAAARNAGRLPKHAGNRAMTAPMNWRWLAAGGSSPISGIATHSIWSSRP